MGSNLEIKSGSLLRIDGAGLLEPIDHGVIAFRQLIHDVVVGAGFVDHIPRCQRTGHLPANVGDVSRHRVAQLQRAGILSMRHADPDQTARPVIEHLRAGGDHLGEFVAAVATDAGDDVISYRRGDAVVLVNARPRAIRVTTPGLDVDGALDLLSGAVHRGATIALPAHGAVVLELQR